LLRHLALDLERFRLPGVTSGEPKVAGQLMAAAGAHWCVRQEMSAEEELIEFRAATARSHAMLADAAPGQEPAAWPIEIWST
jgi:hypothetical protein